MFLAQFLKSSVSHTILHMQKLNYSLIAVPWIAKITPPSFNSIGSTQESAESRLTIAKQFHKTFCDDLPWLILQCPWGPLCPFLHTLKKRKGCMYHYYFHEQHGSKSINLIIKWNSPPPASDICMAYAICSSSVMLLKSGSTAAPLSG